MQCIECKHGMSVPALVLAMEQRQHFALVRNSEVCHDCAVKAVHIMQRHYPAGPGLRHSMECTFCSKASPIMRWRFQMKTDYHDHIAICEKCYATLRDDLLRYVPGIVGFFELEWNTGAAKSGKRLPFAIGTHVTVKSHVPRYHGMPGKIVSFRGLVQPWYGYEVQFDAGGHHFFHERDLIFPASEETGHPGHEVTPSPESRTHAAGAA